MKIITKNFLIERGDAYLDDNRLEIKVPGDWTTSKCSWVVKLDKKSSSDRLIEKFNALAGGSDEELEAVLEGSDTVFKVSLSIENTQNFGEYKYYFDLVAINAEDSSKSKTISKGELKLNYDVQTPFDGYPIPIENIQYQVVNADEAEVGDILMINTENQFEFISLIQLKRLLGELP
jgi:hypothetical protein